MSMLSRFSALGGAPSDPNFPNVILLMNGDGTNGGQNNTFVDSSANAYTVTRVGDTTQGSFSAYGPNWSASFPGTSNTWISAPSGAGFQFGTGDFTIEAWICLTGDANVDPGGTRHAAICAAMGATGVSNNFWFLVLGSATTTGTALYFSAYVGGVNTVIFNEATTIAKGVWYHVAISRSGNTFRLFLNGGLLATATYTGVVTCGTDNFLVGYGQPGTTSNYQTPFPGFISNLRVVKGTAVYTAAFTPSKTPLAAVSGTSLLTCQSNRVIDNGSNGLSLSVSGGISIQRFSPFSPPPPGYTAATYGGSAYFDGTGDYLSFPDIVFNGSFCAECWFYKTANPTNYSVLFGGSTTAVPANNHQFTVTNTGGVTMVLAGTGIISNVGTAVLANQWNHIAYVRSGTSAAIFVNGVRQGTGTSSINNSICNRFADIASLSGYSPIGLVSGIRIVIGSSVYDPAAATVTVPTTPPTAITNTQLLLNCTNAAIFDSSMTDDAITVGNAQVSTSVKKYGTGSMAFDGAGDYLVEPYNPAFNFGAGNFTIECWIYFNSVAAGQEPLANNNGSSLNWALYTASSGTLNYYVSSDGTFWNVASGVLMGNIATGQWYHIALVRNGNVFTPYVNGVAGTTTTSSAAIFNATNPMYIGGLAAGYHFNGYIDDLRITKGVARYTANFTPPTAAFPTF